MIKEGVRAKQVKTCNRSRFCRSQMEFRERKYEERDENEREEDRVFYVRICAAEAVLFLIKEARGRRACFFLSDPQTN